MLAFALLLFLLPLVVFCALLENWFSPDDLKAMGVYLKNPPPR